MAKKKDIEPIEDPIEKEKAWEDLGRPETPVPSTLYYQYAFKLLMNADGVISVEIDEPTKTICRKATTFDIYQSCKELASDIESQALTQRIVTAVTAALQTSDPTGAPTKVKKALGKRGIDTSTS